MSSAASLSIPQIVVTFDNYQEDLTDVKVDSDSESDNDEIHELTNRRHLYAPNSYRFEVLSF